MFGLRKLIYDDRQQSAGKKQRALSGLFADAPDRKGILGATNLAPSGDNATVDSAGLSVGAPLTQPLLFRPAKPYGFGRRANTTMSNRKDFAWDRWIRASVAHHSSRQAWFVKYVRSYVPALQLSKQAKAFRKEDLDIRAAQIEQDLLNALRTPTSNVGMAPGSPLRNRWP